MSPRVAARSEYPWTQGHDLYPAAFEPYDVVDGWVRCLRPESRDDVVYAADQEVAAPADGECYHGIGCGWRETGIAAPRVGITWGGHWGDPHLEATPLVHVVPGSPLLGMGAWPGVLFGNQVILVGTIGNPPELFSDQLLDLGSFSTVDGTPTRIEVRSDGSVLKVYVEGVQVSMTTTGTSGVAIPTELQGSTLHGAAFDGHLTATADLPGYDFWSNWSCRSNA